MELSLSRRLAILLGLSVLFVMVTRLPFIPSHLFSFDSVNLALALEEFDPTRNQPQPPGYPFFVAEARLLHVLLGAPERIFAVLASLVSALSVAILYLLGKRMFSVGVGLTAAGLLFVNPPFWYSGLTSALRPHLALVPIVVAYFCWRSCQGERWCFYAASLALGLGSGVRPELSLLLLPLWGWTAWKSRDPRLVAVATLLAGAIFLGWVVVLAIASHGLDRMIPYFFEYMFHQTQSTSVLLDPATSWRRAAGRAILWTFLGTVPWLWALPLGWRRVRQESEWNQRAVFLALWFFPVFLFNLLVHIGDPDQALSSIPVLCLVGAFCLKAADESLARLWMPPLNESSLATWVALIGNLVLFFGQFPVPHRTEPVPQFRGLQSVTDAVLIGVYESSFARVRWVEQMADLALKQVGKLHSDTERPILILWARDGEPVWRKVSHYLPAEKVYALDEKGDPGAPFSLARLWSGNQILGSYSGTPPIRVPVPKGGRLIWVIAPASVKRLEGVVSLTPADPLYYTDLPMEASPFRYGSFEFVPQ
ncbi:MAG: hypothetical protein A3J28_11935 [Acidobacteria bacterium RIFCSPLOWO2_12_FULL_60_22]|nr:MAG: hypothetical protein A3J28_11935 [Acidobacteria bacterium RIFCSPLOWO2_12_FULL_60_22]